MTLRENIWRFLLEWIEEPVEKKSDHIVLTMMLLRRWNQNCRELLHYEKWKSWSSRERRRINRHVSTSTITLLNKLTSLNMFLESSLISWWFTNSIKTRVGLTFSEMLSSYFEVDWGINCFWSEISTSLCVIFGSVKHTKPLTIHLKHKHFNHYL